MYESSSQLITAVGVMGIVEAVAKYVVSSIHLGPYTLYGFVRRINE